MKMLDFLHEKNAYVCYINKRGNLQRIKGKLKISTFLYVINSHKTKIPYEKLVFIKTKAKKSDLKIIKDFYFYIFFKHKAYFPLFYLDSNSIYEIALDNQRKEKYFIFKKFLEIKTKIKKEFLIEKNFESEESYVIEKQEILKYMESLKRKSITFYLKDGKILKVNYTEKDLKENRKKLNSKNFFFSFENGKLFLNINLVEDYI